MGTDSLLDNLTLVKTLRSQWISTEIYLDEGAKLVKQLKYANNKKIQYVCIQGSQEREQWIIQLKNLFTGEQKNVHMEELIVMIK
jgi:histidyl-tRNA synthetase